MIKCLLVGFHVKNQQDGIVHLYKDLNIHSFMNNQNLQDNIFLK